MKRIEPIKFLTYSVNGVEHFIKKINEILSGTDISKLTNGFVKSVPVMKEHPIVMLFAAKMSENKTMERSSKLPLISVVPGNLDEEGFTLGGMPEMIELTKDDFDGMKNILEMSDKEILDTKGLFTKDQINEILGYHKKGKRLFDVCRSWMWNEEINISCWSQTPDVDKIMFTLCDSVFSRIRLDEFGGNSPIINMKYRVSRGLVNTNFSEPIFGSEISLTFTNKYTNHSVIDTTDFSKFDFEKARLESQITFLAPSETTGTTKVSSGIFGFSSPDTGQESESNTILNDNNDSVIDESSTGSYGREIELRKTDTHLQWRYVGMPVTEWKNLLLLETVRGEKGDKPIKGVDYFDGHTPVKGVDYFDGAKGDKGDAGEKGDTGDAGVNVSMATALAVGLG